MGSEYLQEESGTGQWTSFSSVLWTWISTSLKHIKAQWLPSTSPEGSICFLGPSWLLLGHPQKLWWGAARLQTWLLVQDLTIVLSGHLFLLMPLELAVLPLDYVLGNQGPLEFCLSAQRCWCTGSWEGPLSGVWKWYWKISSTQHWARRWS